MSAKCMGLITCSPAFSAVYSMEVDMGKAIYMRDISFDYGDHKEKFKNLKLTIHAGEVIVITGVSGSGKSTITRLINGLVPQFFGSNLTGEIEIEGVPQNAAYSERSKYIGNVFQDPRSQFFSNEVAGEIAFGCENYGYTHEKIVNQVSEAAQEIGLTEILGQKVRTLSYGMRQKVAIASAKAMEPEIYVMDEPSANLDVEATWQLLQVIKALKAQGKTIVITEHRLYYLMDVADRFLYLDQGKLRCTFTGDQFRALSTQIREQLGLRSPYLYDCSPSFQRTDNEKRTNAVLRIEHMKKLFDIRTVLEDITFSIHRGESVAVIGSNGMGKSTIGKILSGIMKETAGTIWYKGKRVRKKERVRKIWYIPQDLDSWLFGESLLDELLTGSKETTERKQQAHELLMQAAKEEFLECGYEKASMRSIAARADLTGGAVYKHFASKEEMFSALLDPVYARRCKASINQKQRSPGKSFARMASLHLKRIPQALPICFWILCIGTLMSFS